MLTKGTGSVDGNFSVFADLKDKFVEERPWSVNGRSRSRFDSEGSKLLFIFDIAAASSADALSAACLSLSFTLAGRSGPLEDDGRTDKAGRDDLASSSWGNLNSPPLENASLNAGAFTSKPSCLEFLVLSWLLGDLRLSMPIEPLVRGRPDTLMFRGGVAGASVSESLYRK